MEQFLSAWRHSDAQVIAIIVCPCVCLSVCVCMCVCHTLVLYQNGSRRITQTTPRDSPGSLVFWRQNSLVDDPPFNWNLCSKWPTPFHTPKLWPISAHSTSTVRVSEKSSIIANRKSTTRFPTSQWIHPQKAPSTYRIGKICDFRLIYYYVSETIHSRDTATVEYW